MQEPPLAGPIRRRKIYEELVARLEQAIQAEFAPGDAFLSEREIMERFGVGRSATREAMLSLARSGLIEVRTGERARVTLPSGEMVVRELTGAAQAMLAQAGGMRHFQDARTLFEAGLARRAAERATDADLERLRAALEANLAAVDLQTFVRTDIAFHHAVAETCRNPIFLTIHDAVVEWLRGQRSTSGVHPAAATGAHAAHRQIFEAIAARDPVAADAAMTRHMEEVIRFYWQVRAEG